MRKDYDTVAVQRLARETRSQLAGHRYREDGELYLVTDVVVEEASGVIEVVYKHGKSGDRWAVALPQFSQRFSPVSHSGPRS